MLQGKVLLAGTGPFTGSYRPFVAFSTLNPAINPNGVWTLRMVDTGIPDHTGVYRNFSINFTLPGTGGGNCSMDFKSC